MDIIPLEGRGLLPVLYEESRAEHEYIFGEHVGNRAVRKGNWKLVAESGKEWELYDLAGHPGSAQGSLFHLGREE